MRRVVLIISLVFVANKCVLAQVVENPATNNTVEQQLENITENSEDVVSEDDSFLQELSQYIKNPLNLNIANKEQLTTLRFLDPIQINSFLQYRELMGSFLSIYELQAVPNWDVNTIKNILPFTTVSSPVRITESIGQRLSGGDYYILARMTQILEKSRGFLLEPSPTRNYYPGSPQRLFIRYKYNYKNLLQYGFVAEKDPGEQLFKGYQKNGFDFYSAHFFARDNGIIKSLALGDFTVNLGQGLTQWMNLAFRKGPDITSIKRQAATLRPYNSAGEINFHRGAGITLGKKNWELTFFGSYKSIDANFVPADTLLNTEDFVSSLQLSGFHRTKGEAEDKGIQKQLAFGGNAKINFKGFELGINAVHYNFKLPLKKQDQPYNLYSLSGKSFGNYSANYSYTYKNMHFFGEAAVSSKKYPAFIQGMLLSVSNTVDMSFLYRNISKGYQALYATAFTEQTYPTNEKGLFSGISVKPIAAWKFDAYIDMYKFPWLRSRVNAPSYGKEYFIQATYKPSRALEMYTRYRTETKGINFNPDALVLNPVIPQTRQNWRSQISYKLSPSFVLRSRAEAVWYDSKGAAASKGFLLYTDVLYKPLLSKFSGGVRLQYFETDDYNSRIYAYENDVLYTFSIPVFFGKGYRYYLNVNYDLTRRLQVWAKIAQSFYPDQSTIGSGLDIIQGNRRTEVKLQARYSF